MTNRPDQQSAVPPTTAKRLPCHHCEGQGYSLIRDCTGEIQREETCVFCTGTGETEVDELTPST